MPKIRRRIRERRAIVQQVIHDHFLTEEIFYSSTRWTPAVEARRDAILRLAADGAFHTEIAELIGRERTVVRYHLYNRGKRNEYYARRWRENVAKLRTDPEKFKAFRADWQVRWHQNQDRLDRFKRERQLRKKASTMEAAE